MATYIKTLHDAAGNMIAPVTLEEAIHDENAVSLKAKLAERLIEPTNGLAVGKYFRVASIDDSGHAVLEAVDLPYSWGATDLTPGVSPLATGHVYFVIE